MKHKGALLISAASALGLALAASDLIGAERSTADMTALAAAHGSQSSGMRHGWRRGGRGHGMGQFCDPGNAGRIDTMIKMIEGLVSFNSDQAKAWSNLTSSMRTADATIRTACEAHERNGTPDTAPAMVARFDTMMNTGLGVIREVRPSFDAFYAELAPEQKKLLDGVMKNANH